MIATFVVARVRVWEVPPDLGRDEARELARRELSKPSYERDTPIVAQVVRWIGEQIAWFLDAAGGAVSSGTGVALLVAAVIGLAVVIVVRAGPMARRAVRPGALVFTGQRHTAADYVAAADAAAGHSDWNAAVIERYRAVVAALEERGVLPARSGRTADEAAAEAGAVLDGAAGPLRSGAAVFDAVRYGCFAATEADDHALRQLYQVVTAARAKAGSPIPGRPALVAPQ